LDIPRYVALSDCAYQSPHRRVMTHHLRRRKTQKTRKTPEGKREKQPKGEAGVPCRLASVRSSSLTTVPTRSAPAVSIPVVSPSAFICLFTFALLAVVLIQGPLGISATFASPMPLKLASSPALMDIIGKALGSAVPDNAQVLKVQASTSSPPTPQMGGQGQSSGPEGSSQWHWFANPRELAAWFGPSYGTVVWLAGSRMSLALAVPPLNQQPAPAREETILVAPTGMTNADAIAFASLPALLQGTFALSPRHRV
jgi:hypothetical protein